MGTASDGSFSRRHASADQPPWGHLQTLPLSGAVPPPSLRPKLTDLVRANQQLQAAQRVAGLGPGSQAEAGRRRALQLAEEVLMLQQAVALHESR